MRSKKRFIHFIINALLGTALQFAARIQALTCHCQNNAPCNPSDGSCPNGCDPKWYGPACQLGNVAFRKPAFQSSTYLRYTADQAVNGIVPRFGDVTESNCSHTAETRSDPLWWYVRLSENEDFVIRTITITNRQGIAARFLRHFYILHTTDNFGDPDPNTWSQCAYQELAPSSITTTFTCNDATAIARRVAVYIGSHPEDVQMLILCDVVVEGYSYKETANFQDVSYAVTPGCNNITIELANPPVMRPNFLYISVQTPDTYDTRVERILYSQTGSRSVVISAMAGRLYTLWIAPETCCIGSVCLSSVTEMNIHPSKCVIGPNSILQSTTTPQRQLYKLTMTENVVQITLKKASQCSSSGSNFTCNAIQGGTSTFTCSTSSFCNLDPRSNYVCTLDVFYSDGFRDTVTYFFNIGTANFSKVDHLMMTTCDSIYIQLGAVNQSWDIEPSFVRFIIKSTDDDLTSIKQIPYVKSGSHSATFTAKSNTVYLTWVSPVTCWGDKICTPDSETTCFDPSKCAVGASTTSKLNKTPVRQYFLDSSGCCISAKDQSVDACEDLDILNITCTDYLNVTHKSSGAIGRTFCGLSKGKLYTCTLDAVFKSGKIERTLYRLRNDSLLDCSTEIGTANFSTVDLLLTTTCDSIYMELGAVSQSWDIEPSFVRFFLKSTDDDQTSIKQIPYVKSGNHSVTFIVKSNTVYLAWVSPVTCWDDKNCTSDSKKICFDPSKCEVGASTIQKANKTPRRQYLLERSGCCVSAKDQSVDACEVPDVLNITCTNYRNVTSRSSGDMKSMLCGLSKQLQYTCILEAILQSGNVERTVLRLNNDSISDCSIKSEQDKEDFTGTVAGSIVGVIVTVAIIVVVVRYYRNIHSLNNGNRRLEPSSSRNFSDGADRSTLDEEDRSDMTEYTVCDSITTTETHNPSNQPLPICNPVFNTNHNVYS